MITLEQAKQLNKGTILLYSVPQNISVKIQRWKVTSVKTWKRKPNKVEIHLKHGLYEFSCVNEYLLHCFSLEDNTK